MKTKSSHASPAQLFTELRRSRRLRVYPDTFLESLVSIGHVIDVPAGFELLREGQFSTHIHLLLKGSIRLQSRGKIFSHLHQCGSLFGEGSLLMKEPGRETAIAATPSAVLRIPVSRLLELQRDQAFRDILYRLVAQSQQDKFQQLLQTPEPQEEDLAKRSSVELDGAYYGNLSPSLQQSSELTAELPTTHARHLSQPPDSRERPSEEALDLQDHTTMPMGPSPSHAGELSSSRIGTVKSPYTTNDSHQIWQWVDQMRQDLERSLETSQELMQKLSVTQLSSWQQALVTELTLLDQKVSGRLHDLFALSAIENRDVHFQQDRFSLLTLLQETFDLFREAAAEQGIHLHFFYPPALVLQRQGDPQKLKELLATLLEAALQRTTQGEVVLWVEALPQAPDWLRFSVRDSGPALSAEQSNELFSRYHPSDESSPLQGGLRLIMARRLSHAMGGQLSFENSAQQGGRFLLNLCLPTQKEEPLPMTSSLTALSAVLPRASISSTSAGGLTSSELEIVPPPEYLRPLKQARILLIDPGQETGDLVRYYLQGLSTPPDTATGGKNGLERFASKTYDIVLVSDHLPELALGDIIAKLRALHEAQKRTNTLQIMVLVKDTPIPQRKEQIERQGDVWLSKPLKQKEFLDALRDLWKGRRPMNASDDSNSSSASRGTLTSQFDALLQRYLRNLNQRISKLQKALEDQNFGEIEQIGHKLKGSGSSYGFDQITELGRQMEDAGSQKDPAACAQLIQKLEELLQEINQERPPKS